MESWSDQIYVWEVCGAVEALILTVARLVFGFLFEGFVECMILNASCMFVYLLLVVPYCAACLVIC